MSEALIRLPQVIERTGCGRSTIYARIAAGEFPKPVSIGARSVAWVESEITAWVEQRISEARKQASAR